MKTNPHIYPASVLSEGNAGFFVPDNRKEITMSNPQDSPSITIKIRIMNLNEAEIAVTTKRT
ncbi:hypothetical protein [uncultured Bacteroides sp.]|uniref:hypothetical protein n=1 Tax=uncultured Bacteroides sp. TaxID=162156 RepID=UPI00272C4E9B|nr:hypothetical protein [uncultured Bacteroides sp.]